MKSDEVNKRNYELIGNFSQNISITKHFLIEFKKVFEDKEIINVLPLIKGVYMCVIIIYIHKIFSESKIDHFSLDKFREQFPIFKDRIDKIYYKYKDIISKIKNTRHQLIAHTDPYFYKLGFSQAYIDKLIKVYGTDLGQIVAKSKGQERYVPDDLNADLVEINKMIEEAEIIWNESIDL